MLEEIKQQVERSLAPLLGDILVDTEKLIRQEVALAKAELREDFGRLKVMLAFVVLAITLSVCTIVLTLFSLVHGLAAVFPDLPLWSCFVAVTFATCIAAGIALATAKRRAQKVKMIPEQTVETIKESAEWIQRKV